MRARSRLLGAVLLGAWGWWALGWAVDLSLVSPIHWGSLLPRLMVEGVPATAGAVTAAFLVAGSPRTRFVALLCAVVTVQSALVAAAVPDLTTEYDETIRQSRWVWQHRADAPESPREPEPGMADGRFHIERAGEPETAGRRNQPDAD